MANEPFLKLPSGLSLHLTMACLVYNLNARILRVFFVKILVSYCPDTLI